MGIYLLSFSHKTTPLNIRSLFAYSPEQQEQVLSRLVTGGMADEAVVLSTCNRMEIYCYGAGDKDGRRILEAMERVAVSVAGAADAAGAPAIAETDVGRYMRRYHDRKAIRHLFQVAAGLDSIVIGEDQILGQVRQAHEFSHERGYCKTYLNTLFRDAVTGAKKIKTDTLLSRTPVSTASLAVKAAEQLLGGLEGRKMMIIGATGKIGNIVLKNVQKIKNLDIYVTVRSHAAVDKIGHGLHYTAVDFEERYQLLDEMDVVLSATASPHYTITVAQAKTSLVTPKQRVFLDLAVPPDVEESIGQMANTWYYNIEDMTELARRNNERKQTEIETADHMIEEYEDQFMKWMLFQDGWSALEALKESMVQEAGEKGMETAINHLFYRLREAGSAADVGCFLTTVRKVNQDLTLAAEAAKRTSPRRKKAEQPVHFPLFFSLQNREVLVVGAGKIASRRAEVLAEFGAAVTVVAPQGAEAMERLCREGTVRWERRSFVPADVAGKHIVIAATNDGNLNTKIAVLCKENHILVNHAGDKSQCDFYFPGIAREGGIVAGITTSGKDHGLARELTGQLQLWLKKFSDQGGMLE